MLLIYTHKKSNRLLYTLEFIFKEHFKVPYQVTVNALEFKNYMGPKLNYSMEDFSIDTFDIFPVLLMFQEDVTEHKIEVSEWDGVKIFYRVGKGDLPFDIIAATFFMISRYEEYLYANRDRFGRYDPRNSLAWKNKFLYEPVANIWLNRFGKLLTERFPDFKIEMPEYKFIPTIDIDNAFAYLHKGFLRTTGGILMNMLKTRFHNFGRRLKVILGMKKDPYDTYEKINEIHDKYSLKPHIFFLLGNYGGFDRALSPLNKHFRKLIQSFTERAKVGMHASFASFSDVKRLKEEAEHLDEITNQEIVSNRFHFVKFEMPDSLNNLIDIGINNDFSMGYASRSGFRAGYAGSFKFFDLRKNISTNLRIYPFQLMDATLRFYTKDTPDVAFEKCKEIIDKIKSVNGTLITVWHNESLSGIAPWKGWDELYEKVVSYAVNSD
jgi:hypothetical protein